MSTTDEVVTLIKWHVAEYGYPPTIRQLAHALDVSASTVHKRLTQAVEQGLITREPRRPRAIRIKENNE